MKKLHIILMTFAAILMASALYGCGQTGNTGDQNGGNKDEITQEADEIIKTADEVSPEDFNPEKLNDLGEV
jgi:hypothetical protein